MIVLLNIMKHVSFDLNFKKASADLYKTVEQFNMKSRFIHGHKQEFLRKGNIYGEHHHQLGSCVKNYL